MIVWTLHGTTGKEISKALTHFSFMNEAKVEEIEEMTVMIGGEMEAMEMIVQVGDMGTTVQVVEDMGTTARVVGDMEGEMTGEMKIGDTEMEGMGTIAQAVVVDMIMTVPVEEAMVMTVLVVVMVSLYILSLSSILHD